MLAAILKRDRGLFKCLLLQVPSTSFFHSISLHCKCLCSRNISRGMIVVMNGLDQTMHLSEEGSDHITACQTEPPAGGKSHIQTFCPHSRPSYLFRSARTSCTTFGWFVRPSRPVRPARKIWITIIQAYMPYES